MSEPTKAPLMAAFIGQKGGVGKSTLARALAAYATRQGQKVLLADFDLEQLTSVEWAAARLRSNIQPDVDARAFKSLKKLKKLQEPLDLVVADTRGLADELTEDISAYCDVVFMPCGTSQDDLRPTLALARRLSAKRTVGQKIILILSKVGRSQRQLQSAQHTIETAGFELLSEIWPERDGFEADMDQGKIGSEAGNMHLRYAALKVEWAMMRALGI